MFLFTFLCSALDLTGVHPSEEERYLKFVDSDFFLCFDNSTKIELSKFNDGYPDCPDGSDEPGTPACGNFRFFCKNSGSVSKEIPRWAVGDGVCDCCDGSDELYNMHSFCPNTCNTQPQSLSNLTRIFESGLRSKSNTQKVYFDTKANVERIKDRIARLSLRSKQINGYLFEQRPLDSAKEELLSEVVELLSRENRIPPKNYLARIIRAAWRYTFHVQLNTSRYFEQNSMRIQQLEDRVSMVEQISSNFAPFFRTELSFGDFTLRVFKYLGVNGSTLNFMGIARDSIIYDGSARAVIRMVCGPESRILSITAGSPKIVGALMTPAVCTEEGLESIRHASEEEMKRASALYYGSL